MKPLVYFCRWQGARLRLRGRDESAVWGELVYTGKGGEEESQPFRFDLQTSELVLQQIEGQQSIVLDEMGVPVESS
jgi:hypothetical protein